MNNIRPSSELRNNYKEISRLCKETKAPVYLTVNGKGDTALVDIEVLNELYMRLDLYSKLSAGLKSFDEGKYTTTDNFFKEYLK